ncbi:hypothetical protein M153_2910006577 [Pseudoloma neurophilia]|uniref:Uncharacterized protein n=1 Tax=Pseudoloma neurophilia TaxID=146866 RepID=A0A0R0LYZ9_9MICR|nr:hypothetical protein M153_2910006577 [Pseudoloma neurophilia]
MSILDQTEKVNLILIENDIKIYEILKNIILCLKTEKHHYQKFYNGHHEQIIVNYFEYRLFNKETVIKLEVQDKISEVLLIESRFSNETAAKSDNQHIQSNFSSILNENQDFFINLNKISQINQITGKNKNKNHIQSNKSPSRGRNWKITDDHFPFLSKKLFEQLIHILKTMLLPSQIISKYQDFIMNVLEYASTYESKNNILELLNVRCDDLNLNFDVFQNIFKVYSEQNKNDQTKSETTLQTCLQIMSKIVKNDSDFDFQFYMQYFMIFSKNTLQELFWLYSRWFFSLTEEIENIQIILNDDVNFEKFLRLKNGLMKRHGNQIDKHLENILVLCQETASIHDKRLLQSCKLLHLFFPETSARIPIQTMIKIISVNQSFEAKMVLFLSISNCDDKKLNFVQEFSQDIIRSISEKMRFARYDYELILFLKLFDLMMPEILFKYDLWNRIPLLEILSLILEQEQPAEMIRISIKLICKLLIVDEYARDVFFKKKMMMKLFHISNTFKKEYLLLLLNFSFRSTFDEKLKVVTHLKPFFDKIINSDNDIIIILGILQNILGCEPEESVQILQEMFTVQFFTEFISKTIDRAVKTKNKALFLPSIHILTAVVKNLEFDLSNICNFKVLDNVFHDLDSRISMINLFINLTVNKTVNDILFVNNSGLFLDIINLCCKYRQDQSIPAYMVNDLTENLKSIQKLKRL